MNAPRPTPSPAAPAAAGLGTSARLTALCTLLHFVVDGLCACCLYLVTRPYATAHLVGIIVAYNVAAFLTQPLTGAWADREGRRAADDGGPLAPHRPMLLATGLLTLGAVLTGAGAAVWPDEAPEALMWTVALLLGAGNSLFHVWGGRLTAVHTQSDIRVAGLYVSTGALGLAYGSVASSWPLLIGLLLCLGLATERCLAFDGRRPDAGPSPSAPPPAHGRARLLAWAAALVLMGLVMARSYVSQAFTVGLGRTDAILLAVGAVSMVGKVGGGWLAHRLGIAGSMAGVVLLTALCYAGRDVAGPAAFWGGLLLVNCTMAVTLRLAYVVMPGREGLAFGLLAAALMPGFLLVFL